MSLVGDARTLLADGIATTIVLLVAGCVGAGAGKDGSTVMSAQRLSLDDTAALSWLDAREGLVRVPIRIERDAVGQIRAAWLGETELRLAVDDTRLGISLADRVRSACPDDGACLVWLDGHWQRDFTGARSLGVVRFVRAVAPGEPANFVEPL